MIFARRALQRRLTDLRGHLEGEIVDNLASRINRPGRDRLAAMWEVVVFHGLAQQGKLRIEQALASGRRPDMIFAQGRLTFIADVTAVSDEGLDANNPYRELSAAIEAAKRKLGLPIGGADLRVHSRVERTPRGSRTVLRLPEKGQIQGFVRDEILPRLRAQLSAGQTVLRLEIDDGDAGISLTIDPARSPISTGGFAAYDVPSIKDRNPLFNALKAKASQLRSAQGCTGVIVGDADCSALARHYDGQAVSAGSITHDFLRQYTSIDFVLLLTVREASRSWIDPRSPERWIEPMLVMRRPDPIASKLEGLFREVVKQMPKPVMMPVNAALRARETGYSSGYHGGYQMAGSRARIGARELSEILAGHRSIEDDGAKSCSSKLNPQRLPNPIQNVFIQNISQGRLPTSVEVIKAGDDDDDDWIEFEFGEPDPAISPLR